MTATAEGKMLFRIADIKITRERFRPPGDISELATSFKLFGQLQPVLLERDGELIAGMRRLTAAKSLGWTDVWAAFQDEVDELTARSMELEENIRRKDMSPFEYAAGIRELHRLKKLQDPTWGHEQTAQLAGIERTRVVEAVKLANMADIFPELKDAKSLGQMSSWAQSKASSVVRLADVRNHPADFQAVEKKIWLGDSVELIKQVPAGQFHSIVTDPPFGVNYDRRKAGTEQAPTAYEDSEESYRRILLMAPDLFRVLKEHGFCVWFAGPSWWGEAKRAFTEAGFLVDEIPIIWYREGGRAYTTRPDRYLGRQYDMALWCLKGEPQMTAYGRSRSNVFAIPPVSGDERELLVERPIALYQEIIKCVSVEGETVADFFVGSGSVPAAAVSLKRDYFGIELNAERRAVALKKVSAYTP